ncbi:hypothetical protein HN51_014029 [Arachis hypogaea]|uniref:ABC transporter G family member 1 n=1 Tax=Arachis hypogaea TaxID=3818 RepID=UPI0007AF2BE5|nr:ABC transporter G family member 11 isoform X1 [Arachis ipaensis]XP_025639498.1 ABC transporter G family member 11 isoform X1 [Arachis hypogaea]
MSSILQPHVSDCELPNNMLPVLEYETTFEVEAMNEVDHQEEKGVFITWEDLWVTVSDGKNGRKAILQGLKGYAKPGQLLAIMGPSGCGKSTLLDALAGRLGSKSKQTGMILINGRKQALAYGTSAYVTEDDTILTTLTVGEAVYYSAQLQLPDSMSKSEKKERAEFTIREMGLQDAINTRIGGWGSKGISGGQKRRVSICIEILTHPRLLFLDEPTSGLDSAASYYVMSRIASLNKKNGIQMTIIASIHQPSNEIFQLFNNLCLLSSGKTVYFGPVSAANKFFSSNGFPCPSLQNPPDHFVKIINKDFEQEEDPEKGLARGLTTEEAIHILVESYDSSEISHQVHKEIAQMKKRDSDAMEKKSHADFLTQCMVLTRRSFVNMYREVGYHWLRLLIYGALALSLGTMFFDIGSSSESIQARASLLVFVVTFLTFITVGAFPSFVEDMKVFERERLNGHYGVTAYTIGNTLSSVPFLLLMSLIPGAVVYYLVGLHQGHQEFIYFTSILFVSVFLVEGLMMIVASIVPNFLLGIIFGTGILGVMMLDGGFYRLPSDIPKPFWRYPLHYISFHKYAYQGLFKNEFQGLTFTGNNQDGGAMIDISGEEILRNLWQVEIDYSKWNDVAILIGMAVTYRLLFLVIIKSFEKVKPIIVTAMNNCPQAKFRFTKVTRLGAMA